MTTTINSDIQLESSSTEPNTQTGSVYYDDGTNTESGDANFRFYDGQSFRDFTSGGIEVGIVADRKTTGTSAGTYSGAPTASIRTINTVVQAQSWLSLSSNQFTINGATHPGRYIIEWRSQMYRSDNGWHFLEDTSGPTIVGLGTSTYSNRNNDTARCISQGYYEIDITTSRTFEVYIQVSNNSNNINGRGVPHTLNNPDPETYLYVYITRYPT